MVRAWTCPARLCALVAALALVVLSFGIASPATAVTPGLDRGNSEAAHEKNADRKSGSTTSTSTSSAATTGGDAAAKGSGKTSSKSSSSTKSNVGGGGGKASSHQDTPDNEQPVSNADRNQGGANGDCYDGRDADEGPYCGTKRDKQSANGNGGGEAKGRPCAGCVGKADNKNPPGQMPGPQDRNNGYECDGNNGIAKGNPAHTGCATLPTTSDDCPPEKVAKLGKDCEDNPPGDEDERPDAVIGGVQDFANPRPPVVAGVQQFATPPAVAPQAGVLPSTGASSTAGWLMTLGVGLLLMGAALVGLRRHGQAPVRS